MLSIRDERAHDLAKELASLRKITMTAAIIEALQNELQRERRKEPLDARLAKLAKKARAMAGRKGRDLRKDDIDALWGQ